MTMSEVWKYYDCYNWIFEGHVVLEPVEKDKSTKGKEHKTLYKRPSGRGGER